jgi:outer membrane protein, multidrug efflux system
MVAAFMLFGSGCTLAPKYTRPPAPVSVTYPRGGVYEAQPTLTSNARSARGMAAADIGWRDFVSDPRLQKLIELALANNRDLRVSTLEVAASRAQYRITRAELAPALDGVGSGSVVRYPEGVSTTGGTLIQREYNVGLSASWELDFFGRVQSLRDEALSQYLATAQARKAAHIALVAQVADQYITLVAADEQLEITARTLDTARASYALTKARFDGGTGSELDLRESQTVVESVVANQQAQLRARAQAVNALVALLGVPLPKDLPAARALGQQDLLTDIPAGLPSDLLTRRPDIVEAENQLLAANANVGAARAAFFPQISLTGAFGTESASLGNLFRAGTAAWSFGPQITMPIFEAGENVANLDRANVQKRIEVANYEKVIQSAFREVSDGLAARGTYDLQIAALGRDEQAQRRRFTLADLRYRNGVDSYLSVLSAQTDLEAVEQQLVAARLNRWANLVDLYRALGGGWIERNGDAVPAADS